MHELSCPSCNASSQYDLTNYLMMCPFCSVTFYFDSKSGKKQIYTDHFIVPNACDARQVKSLVIRWLKRLHHSPGQVDREFFVVDISGYSIPFWIVSLEAHTAWSGLVKKQQKRQDAQPGGQYVFENGQFRRNYRWGVNARTNICEYWGMTKLHEPKENIIVDWDGFPLDSTYSRGRIDPTLGARKRGQDKIEKELSAYDVREFFEFKYSNGLSILPVQISEEEALRRAKNHVSRYHYSLAQTYTDYLVDEKTELEIAGVQLIHLPFWFVNYVYQPQNLLRHFQKQGVKNLIIEGYSGGVLKSELAMIHRDKLWINSIICLVFAVVLFFIGTFWHPIFMVIAVFLLLIAGASAYIASTRNAKNPSSSFFYGEDAQDGKAAEQDA